MTEVRKSEKTKEKQGDTISVWWRPCCLAAFIDEDDEMEEGQGGDRRAMISTAATQSDLRYAAAEVLMQKMTEPAGLPSKSFQKVRNMSK